MDIAPSILVAALVSALCWSLLDGLRKALGEALDASTLVAAFCLGQAPLFLLWWFVDPASPEHAYYWLPALISLGLNIVANLLFVRSVQVSELSLVVPLLSFTPVFSTLAAIPILGELPTPMQSAGIAVVVLGALVLGRAKRPGKVSALRDPGVWMMLLVALAWSFTTVYDKVATQHASPAFHGLFETGAIGGMLAIYLVLRREPLDRQALKKDAPRLSAAILIAAGAYGLQLFALQGMDAGLVETQKRIIGLLMAVALGRVFFEEVIDRQKWLGILSLGLGTVMTVLGAAGIST